MSKKLSSHILVKRLKNTFFVKKWKQIYQNREKIEKKCKKIDEIEKSG